MFLPLASKLNAKTEVTILIETLMAATFPVSYQSFQAQ
jgi:hypothetical protein